MSSAEHSIVVVDFLFLIVLVRHHKTLFQAFHLTDFIFFAFLEGSSAIVIQCGCRKTTNNGERWSFLKFREKIFLDFFNSSFFLVKYFYCNASELEENSNVSTRSSTELRGVDVEPIIQANPKFISTMFSRGKVSNYKFSQYSQNDETHFSTQHTKNFTFSNATWKMSSIFLLLRAGRKNKLHCSWKKQNFMADGGRNWGKNWKIIVIMAHGESAFWLEWHCTITKMSFSSNALIRFQFSSSFFKSNDKCIVKTSSRNH